MRYGPGILAVLLAAALLPARAQAPEPGRRQIVTQGTGRVQVAPTEAAVVVAVQVQRATAVEASREVARIADQTLRRLHQLGIRRQMIRTSGVQVYPVFSTPRDGAPQVAGYRAIYAVTVTLTDLSLVGPVIDDAVRAGMNQVAGVTWGLRDPSAARREALALAVREAREAAEAIAAAAGLQIAGVERIVEESAGVEVRSLERVAPAPGQALVPIEPGLITVTARVTMVVTF
ncbi:MAG: SIMPL domain-containing protein [Armatimonadota bacterium]|nr:SIMPL domain-containing protein [Armatimonadota bacterium]MDR7437724.1 SIMPL domain-containing protein [Armatimonadota bacterium]MDR7471871.1 SIMPL domain-containing protein [Armatimonadota bacterium]MDR7507271.1 SIMPL domain-containing protein [Armatimonadota bacterium]MDR7509878.1 SIMPL domain-containing protein [Armatimonadota bacterium]